MKVRLKLTKIMDAKEKVSLYDYFHATRILCYTTLALVPVCLLGGWGLWELGFYFPVFQFSSLGGFSVGITLAILFLAYLWKDKQAIKPLLWFYVCFVTLAESLVIYFSGGIVSPAHWLYFLTISELIIFLSPVRGVIVAIMDVLIFLSLVLLEVSGKFSMKESFFSSLTPNDQLPHLIAHMVSMLTLYAIGALFLSLIIFRLNQKRKDLQSSNQMMEKQSKEMRRLLELSEDRRKELQSKNDELEQTKESLFRLMHNIEEVNKRLRLQGKELEHRKDELETLNKKLLRKQEELLKTAAELEKANINLQQLDQMKSEFISTVSHEIRTPLTSIREGVSLVQEKALGSLNKKQDKFMEIVQKNVNRLSGLIHDILDLSQLEVGKLELQRKAVDLSQIIKETVDSMQTMALKRKIRIETSFGKNLPRVYADEYRVSQVLFNLIGNAIKFTAEDGMIAVGAFQVPNEDSVHVSVVDTGKGMAKEEIGDIFNKFHQIGREVGPGYHGTGLGLPICQEIVQHHGGKVWAESELGRGSKFTFTLPIFSTEKYIEDVFQTMVENAEIQDKDVSFILYKILGFGFLKMDAKHKQVKELFDQFMELVVGATQKDSHVVADSEKGFVLILKNAYQKNIDEEVKKVDTTLKNSSFFLGHKEFDLRYHIVKAVYLKQGETKEKLLQFLGIEQEALSQFQP